MQLINDITKKTVKISQIRKLLQSGVDVNLQDSSGSTALIHACQIAKRDMIDVVELLLLRPDIDVNVQDNEGNTALMQSCKTQTIFPEIVEMLLSHPDIDVNIRNNHNYTALINACFYTEANYPDNVINLVHYPGVDVNAQTVHGETPLNTLCRIATNQKPLVALLSHPEIDVNLQAEDHYRTALISACQAGNAIAAELLLEIPYTDVNLVSKYDQTALSEACNKKGDVFIRLLVQYRLLFIPIEILNEMLLNLDNLLHDEQRYDPNLAVQIMEYFPHVIDTSNLSKKCIKRFHYVVRRELQRWF